MIDTFYGQKLALNLVSPPRTGFWLLQSVIWSVICVTGLNLSGYGSGSAYVENKVKCFICLTAR